MVAIELDRDLVEFLSARLGSRPNFDLVQGYASRTVFADLLEGGGWSCVANLPYNVGTGIVGAPECGDVMKLQIEVDDDGNIVDAKFKTYGCGSAIASSSLATEWLKGANVNEAEKINNEQIVEELSLPPVKIHCSILAEDAIKAAVADYKAKQEQDSSEKSS